MKTYEVSPHKEPTELDKIMCLVPREPGRCLASELTEEELKYQFRLLFDNYDAAQKQIQEYWRQSAEDFSTICKLAKK